MIAMRKLLALALAACAHGGTDAGDVDAAGGTNKDGSIETPPDSACGDLPCEADVIYVAKGGVDNNAGTKAAPLLTIGAGVAMAAQSSPPKAVFVGAGTFAESLTMTAGVAVYGNFAPNWTRDGQSVTEIDGASPARHRVVQIRAATPGHRDRGKRHHREE